MTFDSMSLDFVLVNKGLGNRSAPSSSSAGQHMSRPVLNMFARDTRMICGAYAVQQSGQRQCISALQHSRPEDVARNKSPVLSSSCPERAKAVCRASPQMVGVGDLGAGTTPLLKVILCKQAIHCCRPLFLACTRTGVHMKAGQDLVIHTLAPAFGFLTFKKTVQKCTESPCIKRLKPPQSPPCQLCP